MLKPIIEISELNKTFMVPHEKHDTLKENFLNVFKKKTFERFEVIKKMNLHVKKGDFIGIIGRNGSGKSTLLKLMAGIYAPTSGRVNVHGTLVPFLELGIGFQGELTARENIYINATLLGLSRTEIRNKFTSIVEFAELANFIDLKVKNFSSGMLARLAFSIAREADADIYLCDEILAVGDEAFQARCMRVFQEWKRKGKTIVLVSHNPAFIEDFCNRAILLDSGYKVMDAAPHEVLDEYHRRLHGTISPCAAGGSEVAGGQQQSASSPDFSDSDLQIRDIRFYDAAGDERSHFKTAETIVTRIFFESKKQVNNPVFGIAIHSDNGTHLTGPNTRTSSYPIPCVNGKGFIDCIIEQNQLLAGNYFFTASCFDYSCNYPYDYLDKKFKFTIEKNRDNQYGLVEFPIKWRISNQDVRKN